MLKIDKSINLDLILVGVSENVIVVPTVEFGIGATLQKAAKIINEN